MGIGLATSATRLLLAGPELALSEGLEAVKEIKDSFDEVAIKGDDKGKSSKQKN